MIPTSADRKKLELKDARKHMWPLNRLPIELRWAVLYHLDLRDLVAVSGVSKEWRDLAVASPTAMSELLVYFRNYIRIVIPPGAHPRQYWAMKGYTAGHPMPILWSNFFLPYRLPPAFATWLHEWPRYCHTGYWSWLPGGVEMVCIRKRLETVYAVVTGTSARITVRAIFIDVHALDGGVTDYAGKPRHTARFPGASRDAPEDGDPLWLIVFSKIGGLAGKVCHSDASRVLRDYASAPSWIDFLRENLNPPTF